MILWVSSFSNSLWKGSFCRSVVSSVFICVHLWLLLPSVELLDRDIAEHHWIVVAGKAKMARFAVLARMRVAGHVIGDLAQIAIENHSAVQLHSNGRAFHGHFFIVPFADRMLVPSVRGHHAISRAVGLARIDLLARGF